MADLLSLSYWLRGYTAANMLRHYERLVRLFPFSRLSANVTTLRVAAVSDREPLVFERGYLDPAPIDDLLTACREFLAPDAAISIETWWDLWQHTGQDWHLTPTRAALWCYGPEFDQETEESSPSSGASRQRFRPDLRIDLGLSDSFLPDPEDPPSLSLIKQNIQSLLKLVHDADNALPVDTRQLWSESGVNFAQTLQETLTGKRT